MIKETMIQLLPYFKWFFGLYLVMVITLIYMSILKASSSETPKPLSKKNGKNVFGEELDADDNSLFNFYTDLETESYLDDE